MKSSKGKATSSWTRELWKAVSWLFITSSVVQKAVAWYKARKRKTYSKENSTQWHFQIEREIQVWQTSVHHHQIRFIRNIKETSLSKKKDTTINMKITKEKAHWYRQTYSSAQFSPVAQSCPTLCDPMNRSTPGLPVHPQLPEFTQTHGHWVRDAIQPSHPLSSPSPPAPNPSQHQSLFQWVNSSHEVAKVLEFQL